MTEMTALERPPGPQRRLAIFDVVLLICFAILAVVAGFYGIQEWRGNDHDNVEWYFTYCPIFLASAAFVLAPIWQKLHETKIVSGITLFFLSIDKWRLREATHALAVLLWIAAGCYATAAIHTIREKKKIAITEIVPAGSKQ